MHTEDAEDQTGTPEDVARRLQILESLATTLDVWANNNEAKIPRGPWLTLCTYRGSLQGEVLGLRHSLTEYDAQVASAYEQLPPRD